ncbi:MAG: hypothetical protein WAO08_32945, partial [Hyphomicrobiaceae bacterium]
CRGEHDDISEKAPSDQADAAQQAPEHGAIDDAEGRDHDSLRDWQHEIGPDEGNAHAQKYDAWAPIAAETNAARFQQLALR